MQKNKVSESDKSINSADENNGNQQNKGEEYEEEDEGYFLKLIKNKKKKDEKEENSNNDSNFLGRKTNANNPYYEKELLSNQTATEYVGDNDKKSKGGN